ncbi:MAG: CHAT domain-containing protein [Pyrinomonadaceae bacterium]
MAEYEEFRLEISPSLRAPSGWDINLVKCPVADLAGDQGTVVPTFTRTQLLRLRNRHDWPSLTELESIGQKVWESVMTADASAAFKASRAVMKAKNKGLRITVVMLGDNVNPAPGDEIRLSELPVEALCKNAQFFGTDLDTPISRTLQSEPTHDPFKVLIPLRVLVVVAAPADKPPAKADEEAKAIRDALAELAGPGGPVDLEFCEPPTRDELKKRLSRPCHILHFIGHGGFDNFGADEIPDPYVSFVQKDSNKSENVNAGDLTALLKNTGVRLLVLTACSSAAPTPDEEPYRIGAFDGLAQRVLAGVSDISATVAMQFDMESEAAVNFTRVFYENLLRPDKSLDEVVTLARRELATNAKFGAGHRAWVTPTVYWRCKEGKVFDINTISVKPSEEAQRKIQALESQLIIYRRILSEMAAQPPDVRDKVTPLVLKYQNDVEALMAERATLFGESIRLRGDSVKPGAEYTGRLTLRVRLPGAIDLVKVSITYQPDKLKYEGRDAGKDTPGNQPTIGNPAPGELEVIVLDPSKGMSWSPNEYEIGLIKFTLAAGLPPGILDVTVKAVEIRRGGTPLGFVQALDAVVFVEDAD